MMMMRMMLMKAVLAGYVIVCVFPARGVCFSRGASVSSCVNMKPGHISSFPQHTHTHSTVTVRTSRSVYLPQHTLTVTVQSSRAFMGFLLQARSVLEDRVVGGEFTLHPPSTHTLSCLSTDDTITHSDKMLKRNLSFSWRAPTQPSGDLRFYITLVQSYFVYWSRIRSAVVHDGTRSSQITGSITGQPMVNTTASLLEKTGKHTSLSTQANTHTNTHATHNTHTTPSTQANTHTNTHATHNTHTTPSTQANTHTNTHSISAHNINTPTPDNTHKKHTVPNAPLQTHASLHTTTQQTHTYTPPVHTHNTQFFTASLHPEPSPAPRRALSDFFPSREPTEGDISLTQHKKHPSDLFGDVLNRPKQAKDPSGVPGKGIERPEHVPRQSAFELGLLLGLSTALGMAIAVGLRYLQRKHCGKRTAVSLNDCNHGDRGIIHVQEGGDLVQVRKIRQNSFLVLQAEYNLITPTGN
ncbi:reelin domain-containing protein 1-like [Onychostoma macrolepis]|uniref:reelin domain-containing protein 1-like n=1 Tax=Onychostoma macrolepis TaxID=369639 RepID=UPI002729BCD7|nr:reelin domain-containing protein 1-like [Onychostoma macrolepis]